MDIKVFVSPDGHIAFTCHGEFNNVIDQVNLDGQTGIIKFIFATNLEEEEMNCVIHEELCIKMQNQLFCSIGYFKDNKLVASADTPKLA